MSNLIGTLAKVAIGVAAIKGVGGNIMSQRARRQRGRTSTVGSADQGQRRRAPRAPSPGLQIR